MNWEWRDVGIEVSEIKPEPRPKLDCWRIIAVIFWDLVIFGFCGGLWWLAFHFGLRLWNN